MVVEWERVLGDWSGLGIESAGLGLGIVGFVRERGL